MESGAEVLRAVNAICSAFHTAADLLESIKDRKEKKKRKKEKEVEELLEIRILHKSLIEGSTKCRKHCDARHQQFGTAFENGDAIANPALKDVAIAIQTEINQALHFSKAVENAILDFTTLHESSVTTRKDATRAMDQLCQRITARMQFQTEQGENRFSASDASMRSTFASIQPSGQPSISNGSYGTPSLPSAIASFEQAIYQRPLPALPQRTLTAQRPGDHDGKYPASQMSIQSDLATRISLQGRRLSVDADTSTWTGSSSTAGDEEQSQQDLEESLAERMSPLSIQDFVPESASSEQPMQYTGSISTQNSRNPIISSTTNQVGAEPGPLSSHPPRQSSHAPLLAQLALSSHATQSAQLSPSSHPPQTWQQPLSSHPRNAVQSPEPTPQADFAAVEPGPLVSSSASRNHETTGVDLVLRRAETDTLSNSSRTTVPPGHGYVVLRRSETDTLSTSSRTTGPSGLGLSRIEGPEDLLRAIDANAPEVVSKDFGVMFSMRPVASPDLEVTGLSSEKYLAYRTESDYAESLFALSPGMDNVWLPLARPAMHNRYHGFCKGAWQTRKAVHDGIEIQLTPALREPIVHWCCKVCKFRSKAPHADALPDQILFNQKYNTRYRWLFLAKSHISAEASSETPETYKYGCVFCAAQGQPTAIYDKLDHLWIHIVSKHKTTMMTPEVRQKTKCVVGGVADRADWDISIPESNQKGSGVATDEFLITASKLWGRRKGKRA